MTDKEMIAKLIASLGHDPEACADLIVTMFGGRPTRQRSAVADTHVYALRDPRTNKVMYVGRSLDPFRRLADHLGEARRYPGDFSRKNTWLRKLMSAGTTPYVDVLQTCPRHLGPEKEEGWIADLKPECNIRQDGKGGTL